MQPRNEHVYQSGQKAYDLLVEYLTDNQKIRLTEQLNALPYSQVENTLFAKEIQQGDWVKLFTAEKQAEFPARSLRCLRDGLITTMQYVTSQLFYNVFTHPNNKDKNVKIEKIFTPDGKLIKNAMAKIEATMKLASSSFIAYLDQKKQQKAENPPSTSETNPLLVKDLYERMVDMFFEQLDKKTIDEAVMAGHVDWASEAERNQFYRLLSKLPASEQSFIILDDPFFDGINISAETSVIQQINYRIGFNIFSRLRVNDRPKVMVPSAGMVQTYLEATRPTTRMPAIYRFGFSPVEGLYQTMKLGCRDKIICTALLPECTPDEADDHPANIGYGEADLHDFYHEKLCADIPRHDQLLFGKFIDKLQSIGSASTSANVSLYAASFRQQLIDMEHRAYDRNLKKSMHYKAHPMAHTTDPRHRFWTSLNIAEMYSLSRILGNLEVTDESQIISIINECRSVMASLLANWLLENDKLFSEQLDFDLTKLMDFSHANHGLVAMIQQIIKREYEYEDITQAIRIAFQRKSLFIVKMVCKTRLEDDVFGKSNFMYYMETGFFTRLKAEYPNELAYFIDHFCLTSFADTIMKEMLSKKRHPLRKDIVDLLYPHNHLNHVYGSDKMTLVQRALYADDVDLLFRLTNDGASVDEVPGATKPCPLVNVVRTGRYDLMVILVYGYHHGAGWVQKFPDVTARIRRMALPYQSRFLKAYPEKNEDQQWATQILENANIPAHLYEAMDYDAFDNDLEECESIMRRFLSPAKSGEPMTDAEAGYLVWAHQGGALPGCKK